MPALQRHQLAWLRATAWQRVLAPADPEQSWDSQAAECLQHWARHELPLVVTRQPGTPLTLGLAAPARWGRRRLFVHVHPDEVSRVGAFPLGRAMTPLLPAAAQKHWLALCDALDASGATVRVYGSYGWQAICGLAQVRESSDLDLLLAVDTPQQADAVASLLQRTSMPPPRLDGELLFPDGSAVAWREWSNWRAGQTPQILVKRTGGALLADGEFWAGGQ